MIAFSSHDPIRICFICDEYPPAMHGGIGSQIQILARALVAEGHEARVLGTQAPGCRAPTYENDRGVRVWRFPVPRWQHAWPLSRYRIYQQVSRWCRDQEIDVVEVCDFTGPAARWPKLPVPVIARIHGSSAYFAAELGRKLKPHYFWIERSSLRRADFVCSISAYAAKRTSEVFDFSAPIDVLHDFINLPTITTSQSRSDNQVVYSGTLTSKKGVVQLFEAWRNVIAKRPDARLHMYGKDCRTDDGGSMKEKLIAMLDPSMRHTTVFHGHTSRDELLDALSQARVGVFPSYSETFGLAPVESMAAGCPTIYGNCGCASEVVRDGVDGLLIDPDQTDQLSDAIVKILNDNALAQRLSVAGRQRVEQRFSAGTMLPRNEEYYANCMKEFSDPAAKRTHMLAELSESDLCGLETANSRGETEHPFRRDQATSAGDECR